MHHCKYWHYFVFIGPFQQFSYFFFFFKFINKCQKEILRCTPPSSHVCDFSYMGMVIWPFKNQTSSNLETVHLRVFCSGGLKRFFYYYYFCSIAENLFSYKIEKKEDKKRIITNSSSNSITHNVIKLISVTFWVYSSGFETIIPQIFNISCL